MDNRFEDAGKENKGKDLESIDDIDDNEMEEGGIEVDWEGMYEAAKSNISRLIQDGKYKCKEYEEETRILRGIPMEEKIKILQIKTRKIGSVKAVSDVEAVRKYVSDEDYQKKCLRILEGVRKGKKKIIGFNEYSSKRLFGKIKVKNGNYLLSKAAIQAIEANDLPSLKALSKGCFLPSGNFECSLFEYSCRIHADDCALYLLDEGGGIEQEFENGDRPLIQALRGGNEEIWSFLKERGAQIYKADEGERMGKETIANILGYSIDTEVSDGCRYTPLHEAAFWNRVDVAKSLIDRGADIETKDKDGETPLHKAAEKNSIEIAKLLIERGADIEAKDKDGETPLHKAAEENSIEIAKLLIERGADIEAKDKDGKTPLHKSFSYNRGLEVAQLLIEKRADIKVKDKKERTPLHKAAEKNSIEIAKLLIERGADIEEKDKDGETPLHKAAEENSIEVAQLLIEKGADIKAKDKKGRTPLHKAARGNSSIEVAKLLVERGADIKAKDEKGRTPLHAAASSINDSFEFAKKAFDEGYNIESKENERTPLHYAITSSAAKIANLLIERGANVKKEDIYGKTPLQLIKNKQIVKMIKG